MNTQEPFTGSESLRTVLSFGPFKDTSCDQKLSCVKGYPLMNGGSVWGGHQGLSPLSHDSQSFFKIRFCEVRGLRSRLVR